MFKSIKIFLPCILFYNFAFSQEELVDKELKFDKSALESLSPKNAISELSGLDPRLKQITSEVINLINSNDSCNNKVLDKISTSLKEYSRGLQDELFLLEGFIHENCKDLSLAKKSYNNSLKLRRNNPTALFRLVAISIQNNEIKEAKNLIQETKWQGYKDTFVLNFLEGVILTAEHKWKDAVETYKSVLKVSPNYLPAAKSLYTAKLELRKKTKDKKSQALIDQELPNDLALICKLEPNNYSQCLSYIKYLLSTGDFIKSPNKLSEGEKIVDYWLNSHRDKQLEFSLLKVQFLEKQNKENEILTFINNLEKEKKLTSELVAKRKMIQDQSATSQ